jgi:radical SAM protein with 4Fe4S-binding SPASM domain
MSRVPLPIFPGAAPDGVMEVAPPLPREIQVEVTGACNLRCRMCLVRYRPPLPRVLGGMPFETFRSIVDALPELEIVTLQGLGEPLLAPDLFAMVEYASRRGIRMGFNTNATLLGRRQAERLVDAGLAWLCFSIDGARADTYESIRDGASFAEVEQNVRGVVQLVRERGASLPELSIVFVAMRRNVAELPDMVRLAADWGVPKLRVQNLSHSFEDTGLQSEYDEIRRFTDAEALWREGEDQDHALAEEALAEARALAGELGVALRLPSLAEEAPAPRAGDEAGCDWPWRSSYVRHDGGVQPCCMLMGDDRAILGDVGSARFGEVWRGPAYRSFRAALRSDAPPDVCRGCSMYRGIF